MPRPSRLLAAFVIAASSLSARQSGLGYYRYPAVSRQTIVFTAEGDLWRVPVSGGVAQRLTSHFG